MNVKRTAVLLLAALLGASLISGCGSKSKPVSSGKPGTTPQSTQSTQEGGTTGTGETTGATSQDTQNADSTGNSTARPSTSVTGSKPSGTKTDVTAAPGDIAFFKLDTPLHGQTLATLTPTFTWGKAAGAASYTLVIEEYQSNGVFQKKMEKAGITGNSYKLTSSMKANATYRWSVTAVNSGKKLKGYSDSGEGNVFMSKVDPKSHPANKGLNFTFKNTVSEEVLRNYLSRSICLGMLSNDFTRVDESLRMIYNTGAKYIARATACWEPGKSEYDLYPKYKEVIAKAHAVDPELVFEACVFETTFKSVETIPIPSWVFEAFGQPVENRNFSYDKMVFTDGTFKDRWGTNGSVPDMTRIETQMFFYYRACGYIDLGFEGLHMGQVHLVGAHDSGWACWQKVLNMIRVYAKTHARRGFVFFNAHTSGMKGPDGKLLFDFHASPYRGKSPEGSVAHIATQENPQEIELRADLAIYNKSLGGTTYSGWSCNSLPYFVELDNWSGYDKNLLDKPTTPNDIHFWGFDEISWFANQPKWYRHQWLDYAFKWVRKTDSAGYGQMPGSRGIALRSELNPDKINYRVPYYANSTMFDIDGFDDEYAIRQVWINDRNSR